MVDVLVIRRFLKQTFEDRNKKAIYWKSVWYCLVWSTTPVPLQK